MVDYVRLGNTAIHLAVDKGDVEIVTCLLQAGADPRIPGWMKVSAWDYARESEGPHAARILELITKAIDSE